MPIRDIVIALIAIALSANAFAARPEQEAGLPVTGRTVGGPGVYTAEGEGTNVIYRVVPLNSWIFTPCVTINNKGSATAHLEARYPEGDPYDIPYPPGSTATVCFEDDEQPPTALLLFCEDGGGECRVFWRLDSYL